MTRIRCRASACLFWEHGICGAEEIEYEPDEGCLTFQDMIDFLEDMDVDDPDWEAGAGGTLVVKNDDDDDDDDWEDDDDEFDL